MADKKRLILIVVICVAIIAVAVAAVTLLPRMLADKTVSTEPIQGGEISGEMGVADSEFEDNDDALPPEYTSTPSEPSEDDDTTPPTEDEPQTPEEPTTKPNTNMTYEEFQSLTPAQMRAFEESFETRDDFFDWYNAAKAKYEAENPTISPDKDGVVDLEKK